MFNKLKQYKDLRNQAKAMQSALSQESITYEKGVVKVTMNGNMEITALEIKEGSEIERIKRDTIDAVNETNKKVQRLMAEKMRAMGGMEGFKSPF
jgi:DNA-binding protein YbaB